MEVPLVGLGRWFRPREATEESVRRALVGVGEVPRPLAVGAVGSLLAASWAATYLLGGAGSTAPHWFYLPILLAAARFGWQGALFTAVVSGVLAGPMMPEDASAGTSQPVSDWLSRAGFFVGIGLVMAALVSRAQEAARQYRELVAQKEAVIGSVTHEFRTPLTVIRGAVELFEAGDVDAPSMHQFVGMLRTAAERLNDLVDLVISAAERDVPPVDASWSTTQVDAVAEDVVASLERLEAPRRVEIHRAGPAFALGPPRLFTICLRAVIENALKFSPGDSGVAVVIEDGEGQVRVVVRDHGPGIDPEVACRSAEAGFATARSTATVGGGLGLGLFAAARAAEQLGGAMTVGPAPDGGTRALLSFPSAEPVRG